MSSKSLHIDKRITSLELTGGKECSFVQVSSAPDLIVYGGAHIHKASCFDDLILFKKDVTIQGNLTVLQDSYLPNIYSDTINPFSDCLTVNGNLCVNESLTVDEDTLLKGDLTVLGSIIGNITLPNLTNLVAETLHVTEDSQFDGNVTISGDLIAPGDCLNIIGNVCISGDLTIVGQTSFVKSWSGGLTGLTPSIPSTGDVVLDGTLNVGHGGTGNSSFPVGALLIGDGTNPIQTTMPITYGVGSFPNPVNTITGVPTPFNASDVVPKSYVDAAVSGLNVHDAVYVSTVGPLTATYSNGALGVGATLTNAGPPDYLTLDTVASTVIDPLSDLAVLPQGTINVTSTAGFASSGDLLISASPTTLVSYTGITATSFTGCTGGSGTLLTGQLVTQAFEVGQRVLVKTQTNQTENGIYDITVVGDLSTSWVMTRSSDFDNSTPGQVIAGDFVFISFGQLFGATGWVQTQTGSGVDNVIVIGTDNIIFTQFSGGGSYLAGTGLTLSGLTFSITNQIMAGTTAANQVPQITYNNQGQITSVGTTPLAIPVIMDNLAAIPNYPTAPQSQGMWYGPGTKAFTSASAVNIGLSSRSTGTDSISIGTNANSNNGSGDGSHIAIGSGAVCINGNFSSEAAISIGVSASCLMNNTTFQGPIAIGRNAVCNYGDLAIGQSATATLGLAIGGGATSASPNGNSLAVGGGAYAGGGFGGYQGATSVGYAAAALFNDACAFGWDARADAPWAGSSAFGAHARATASPSVVCYSQTAIGSYATSLDSQSGVACGSSAIVNNSTSAVAVGGSANVTSAVNGVAVGGSASVTGASGIAIGGSAVANIANAISIGQSATPLSASYALALTTNAASVTPGILGLTLNGAASEIAQYSARFATTVSSTTPIFLYSTSAQIQRFSGSAAQPLLLPSASTVTNGFTYMVANQGSANITVSSTRQTTVSVASTLPVTCLNVASVSGFDASGTVYVVSGSGVQTVTYTSLTPAAATITGATTGVNPTVFTAVNSFTVGQFITISGVNPGDYDGSFIVSAATGTTFEVAALITGPYVSGGTATPSPSFNGTTGGVGAISVGGLVRQIIASVSTVLPTVQADIECVDVTATEGIDGWFAPNCPAASITTYAVVLSKNVTVLYPLTAIIDWDVTISDPQSMYNNGTGGIGGTAAVIIPANGFYMITVSLLSNAGLSTIAININGVQIAANQGDSSASNYSISVIYPCATNDMIQVVNLGPNIGTISNQSYYNFAVAKLG
jgi:hypothetical protein